MKTSHRLTKDLVLKPRPRPKLDVRDMEAMFAAPTIEPVRIQWPSEQQLQDVSRKLARISRAGIRSEANGDYFNSGELAYQLQEIIRATADLFKKSQRVSQ